MHGSRLVSYFTSIYLLIAQRFAKQSNRQIVARMMSSHGREAELAYYIIFACKSVA